MEDVQLPGMAPMGGAGGLDDMSITMDMMPGDSPDSGIPDEEYDECDGVSSEVLDLARELVIQAGSADKAREVIDKVDEVMDLLDGVVDDGAETDVIAQFANSLPDEPDLPNNRHNEMGMTAMFDPNYSR